MDTRTSPWVRPRRCCVPRRRPSACRRVPQSPQSTSIHSSLPRTEQKAARKQVKARDKLNMRKQRTRPEAHLKLTGQWWRGAEEGARGAGATTAARYVRQVVRMWPGCAASGPPVSDAATAGDRLKEAQTTACTSLSSLRAFNSQVKPKLCRACNVVVLRKVIGCSPVHEFRALRSKQNDKLTVL